ncbi:MAG: hypothetical protein VB050_10835 [Geobacteraceae bacterium]|nr:hypothetical protein [Geobacteraceae bacterium]
MKQAIEESGACSTNLLQLLPERICRFQPAFQFLKPGSELCDLSSGGTVVFRVPQLPVDVLQLILQFLSS